MDIAQLLQDAVHDRRFWHTLLLQDEAFDIMARLAPALARIVCQDKFYMRAVVNAACASWPAPPYRCEEDYFSARSPPLWHQRLLRKRKAPLSSRATPGPALTLPGRDSEGLFMGDLAKRVKISRKATPLAVLGPLASGGEVFTMLARPSSSRAPLLPAREVVGIGPLGGELTALVLAHLSFRAKVTVVRGVASGMMKIMENEIAWNPLHLARTEVKMFLRIITSKEGEAKFPSSLSSWERDHRGSRAGITKVKCLMVDLMEPEEDHIDGIDSGDSDEPENELRALAADPFGSLMFYLELENFHSLRVVHVANIKPSSTGVCLDSFAKMRKDLQHFSLVCLTHEVASDTLVYKALLDAPPELLGPLDLEAASRRNRSRVRAARVRFDDTTSITESEALFLDEVLCAYKNGDRFFATFEDDRLGTQSKTIRKYYKPVLAGLSARFPQQFAAIST